MIIFQLSILFVLFIAANSYPSGAPNTRRICISGTPSHGSSRPRNDALPYNFDLSVNEQDSSMTVHITTVAGSQLNHFKGLLLTVRSKSSKSVMGTFTEFDSNLYQETCNSVGNFGVTHTSKAAKNSSTFTWKAANSATESLKDMILRATIVYKYDTFWKSEFPLEDAIQRQSESASSSDTTSSTASTSSTSTGSTASTTQSTEQLQTETEPTVTQVATESTSGFTDSSSTQTTSNSESVPEQTTRFRGPSSQQTLLINIASSSTASTTTGSTTSSSTTGQTTFKAAGSTTKPTTTSKQPQQEEQETSTQSSTTETSTASSTTITVTDSTTRGARSTSPTTTEEIVETTTGTTTGVSTSTSIATESTISTAPASSTSEGITESTSTTTQTSETRRIFGTIAINKPNLRFDTSSTIKEQTTTQNNPASTVTDDFISSTTTEEPTTEFWPPVVSLNHKPRASVILSGISFKYFCNPNKENEDFVYAIIPGTRCRRFVQSVYGRIVGEQNCPKGTSFQLNKCVCSHTAGLNCPKSLA